MKHKFLILPLLIFIVACSNNRENAEALYMQAEQLYNNGEYTTATQYVDSISHVYPQEVEIIRRGMLLQCHINQKYYENELIRIDSLYNATISQLESLKGQFNLVREGKEQTLANYVYKNSRSDKEISRSALRAHVTEKGDFILTSVYFGNSKINHTGISTTAPSGNNVATTAIAYDGGKNYRYTTGNNNVEMVSYNLTQCGDVADAIAQSQGKMSIKYTGGRNYTLSLDNNSRNAIAATLRLAQTMAMTDSLMSLREYSIMQLELADRQLMKLEDKNNTEK